MYINRTIIILIAFTLYVCVTGMTMPVKKHNIPLSTRMVYNYKPPLHDVLWKTCNLYYVGSFFGEILPDTNLGLSGNHYFHSSEKRIHQLVFLDINSRIIGARSIFISAKRGSGNARITNYDGIVTIINNRRSIELGKNETLLIGKNGKFEKFTNEFAGADSLWLTSGEIWFNNVDMTNLINRMAINYGCKVQFNNQPSDERVINAPNLSFDCKSGSLEDGLRLLQTISTQSQNFSFHINNGIIFIDKYSELST